MLIGVIIGRLSESGLSRKYLGEVLALISMILVLIGIAINECRKVVDE